MSVQRIYGAENECTVGPTCALDYEERKNGPYVRYLEHGQPNPLERWHCHQGYELHLIVATRGKVFVGDYIGQFEPGHLVLTGPRLPHSWISTEVPPEGIALRDVALQFADTPLRRAAELIPDLAEALPLLERARHGIEFFGLSEVVRGHCERIKHSHGLRRLAEFSECLACMARCRDYRQLSTVQLQSDEDDASRAKIGGIVDYVVKNCTTQLSMVDICAGVGMGESSFSRYFRRATGNTFTEFVNRLRINQACQLLMETDLFITDVSHEVGFNNVANFSRRFLQIKGMTPKEYRRVRSSA